MSKKILNISKTFNGILIGLAIAAVLYNQKEPPRPLYLNIDERGFYIDKDDTRLDERLAALDAAVERN